MFFCPRFTGNSQAFHSGQALRQRRTSSLKRLQIPRLIIQRAVLPAAIQDPNPFERQRAHGGMMVLALRPFLFVISSRPHRLPHRKSRKFVKGLPQKLRTRPAHMDPVLVAAALPDRRDAARFLHLLGALETLAAAAKSRQQSRRQSRPRARQPLENRLRPRSNPASGPGFGASRHPQ